ncbi:MAG: DNA repair protein RecN [Bacteroidia bacterium]|nr:DNA repair protein RecN [Bacteroidia bacterium]
MLTRLSVQNLAFLRQADIEWSYNLNIITGETGAGKSLLIESLSALLGYKADLPPLTEKAIVEAEFDTIPEAVIPHLPEPADTLILRCEILPTGRRRFFLNDSPASAQILREIAYYLVEIHSQHESQQLFQAPFQRELLDSYADLRAELHAYQALYTTWKERSSVLAELEKGLTEREERLAWLSQQIGELKSANLSPDEYAQLEKQIRRLDHQAQALQLLSQWFYQLSENPHAPSTLLREAEKALGRLPLPEIQTILNHLEEARTSLQEALTHIETLLSEIALNPEEAERLRQRYDLYNTLLIKYRVPTVGALLDLFNRLVSEYEMLSHAQESVEPLRNEVDRLTQALLEKGYRLELARLAAAQALSDHVQSYLADLGLGYAHFHIAVERIYSPDSPYKWADQPVQLTPYGFSTVTFLLRTAPDFPLAPLSQVASGGELSRIMLALKAALAEKVQLPTLVLDEIDTGLSGEGARRMGEFLSWLSKRVQIILITHLPAIAAQRGSHFYIWRDREGDTWRTYIRQLSSEERIQEVARLLSGEAVSEAALAAARDLLNLAAS